MSNYAYFNQIFTATQTSANVYEDLTAVAGATEVFIYPADPTDPNYDPTLTFVSNGSTNTVWLKYGAPGSYTVVQGELTNGEERAGGASTSEDIWTVKVGTTYYVLTSGSYTTIDGIGTSENINSSISLADLDQLAAEQTAADLTPPAAPTGVDLLASSDTGVSNTDNVTSDATPTLRVGLDLSGTFDTRPVAGDQVKVYDGATLLGTVTLTNTNITNGYVDFTPSTNLTDGTKSFTATITDQQANTSTASAPLSVSISTAVSLGDSTYTENQGTIVLDSTATITGHGSTDFTGGYLEFSITNATSTETLGLTTVATADTTLGALSIVGSTVYRGTGSGTEVIGSVDSTYDGQNGNALRINFSNAFENGDFDVGVNGGTTISGWTSGVVSRVLLDGVYQIAGQATPDDNTYGPGNTTQDVTSGGTFTPTVTLSDYNGGYSGDLAIRLDTGSTSIAQPYGTIRGPYVYSNGTVSLQAGDSLSFAWKALSGGDAYDAYGYIIDVNDGSTITILDSTGTAANQETTWATVNRTIAAGEEGVYRFVFVTGSYDLTGGQYLGAALMIDDVTVVQANPPGAVSGDALQTLSRFVTYTNTADDILDTSRTVNLLATDGGSTTVFDSGIITITEANDAPTLSGPATLAAVLEDTTNPPGATVQTIVGGVFQDADMAYTPPDSMSGIVIVGDASTAGQGAWEYSTDGGTTWLAIGAVAPDAGLVLDTTAMLRFVPAADFKGAPGALSIHSLDSTYAGAFTSGATQEIIDLTVVPTGGTTAISASPGTLTTSITSVIDAGALNITDATDTGADDLMTGNRNPVIEFTGEAGLNIVIDGPAAGTTLLSGSQYTVTYNAGTSTYSVTLLDANTGVGGNQGFGTYDASGNATGNAANSADGTYSIVAQDTVGGVSATVGSIVIDTSAPPPANIDITTATDTGANDTLTGSNAPVLEFQSQAGLTISIRGPGGTLLDSSQYSVSYNAGTGTYSVTFLDASTTTAGNQPFGSYVNGTATGNSANTADGTYTIIGAGSNGTPGVLGTIVIDTTKPTAVVDVIEISSDTGVSDNDFLTSVASQTVTATLSEPLAAGDKLWGSLDGGSTWTDVTSSVSGTLLTWTGRTLSGTSSIQFRVGDEANNYSATTAQPYTIDQTAPTFGSFDITTPTDTGPNDLVTAHGYPVLTFTGEADLTVRVRGADGTLLNQSQYSVAFSNGTYTVTFLDADLLTAGSQPFGDYSDSGATGNGAATRDGTYLVNAADRAGNTRTVGTFTLDTDRPTTTVSAIDISVDTGTSATDFVTSQASQTVTATLSAPLAAGESLYGSTDGGLTWTNITAQVSGTGVNWTGATLAGSSTIALKVMNAVGASGVVASQAYVLDTTAPGTTASAIDISVDTGTSATDFVTSQASQTVTATLSAPLAAGEILYGSVDGGATWTNITASVSGTGVSWTGVTLSGSNSIVLKVTDSAGNDGATTTQAYVLDTTAPGTTASAIDISVDTGTSASDFVTNQASQTVTATLSAPLAAGEILYGSVDGGQTWTDITASVSGTGVSWTGVTLSGSSSIVLKVTDSAGNDGTAASQAYVLDTTPPATVSGIDISWDTGRSDTDFIINNSWQAVTASLSAPLAAGDILYGSVDGGQTWTNINAYVNGTGVSWGLVELAGSSSIVLRVIDAAGNVGTAATQAYVFDTDAPAAANYDITTPTDTQWDDWMTANNFPVAEFASEPDLVLAIDKSNQWLDSSQYTVVYSGGTYTVSLVDADTTQPGNQPFGAYANGVATGNTTFADGFYTLFGVDVAGNIGFLGQIQIDTTPPTTTASGIDISDDTGSSASDFVTNEASQTVTATLSAPLAAGEILYGSVDGGQTWTDISASVSGTGVTWSGVTLSGASSIVLKVTDSAGNDGTAASQAYVLDTTAPASVSAIDISDDTGASASDFLTKEASQTVTATLSAPLAAGESLYGSVDGGQTWTDITASVSGTGVSWSGATLSGASSIVLKVTDAAGNEGAAASQAYVLDTSAPVVGLVDITPSTDSGADDSTTTNGLPVLTFTGEAGLQIAVLGSDGSALAAGQFDVTYAGGAYTVTMVDANLSTGGAQSFGDYTQGLATGNAANSLDGTYQIVATDVAGNSAAVGDFTIDTLAGVHRYYNATSNMHIFTTNMEECQALSATGWRYEGVGFLDHGETGTIDVFRFYNARNGDHLYTTDADEAAALGRAGSGYVSEGVAFTLAAAADGEAGAVERLYRASTGEHFYTTDAVEAGWVKANLGYTSEGYLNLFF